MTQEKIKALDQLGDWILSKPDQLELAKLKSKRENEWFDLQQQENALEAIASQMLDQYALEEWLSAYKIEKIQSKNVGLILAGNIPAVGFHDVLCVYLSGHNALIKLSDKDKYLIPAMINKLNDFHPESREQIHFVGKLKDIDSIIATGSNNSNRYFEYYFGHLPHILRGNRNSIALLSSNIDRATIKSLGRDVFDYYGLGCRSVSQILIPSSFNENQLLEEWEDFSYVFENSKYENNYKYNYATNILNKEEFKTNDFVILKESEQLASRIACIHVKKYDTIEEAKAYISKNREELQVCVSDLMMDNIGVPVVPPGQSQQPGLTDYADGVDTLQFLISL